MSKVKWIVKITTTVEVATDLPAASRDAVINLAHGPEAHTVGEESEVVAVEIDGKRFDAAPF